MILRAQKPTLPPLRRLLACAGVLLVLLLGTASVSPTLHELLHADADEHVDFDHRCAVVLFASGVTFALAAALLTLRQITWTEFFRSETAVLFLAPPRYLRQPERGPPVRL